MRKLITFFAIIAFVVSLWFTAFAACGTITPKDYTYYHHLRDCLSGESLDIYDKIEDVMINNRKHLVLFTDMSVYEVHDIAEYVYYDHPEVLNHNIEESVYVHGIDKLKLVTFFYADEMLDRAYDEVDYIVEQLQGYEPMDQISLLYEYLTSEISYSKDSKNCENIYGALVRNNAKCTGIAKAFACVVTKLGYDNTMVYTRKLNTEGHIWNRVLIDGTWYEFDATFDLGHTKGKWKYFGVANAHPEAADVMPLQ